MKDEIKAARDKVNAARDALNAAKQAYSEAKEECDKLRAGGIQLPDWFPVVNVGDEISGLTKNGIKTLTVNYVTTNDSGWYAGNGMYNKISAAGYMALKVDHDDVKWRDMLASYTKLRRRKLVNSYANWKRVHGELFGDDFKTMFDFDVAAMLCLHLGYTETNSEKKISYGPNESEWNTK